MNNSLSQSSIALTEKIPFTRDRITWLAYGMLSFFNLQAAMLSPLLPFLREELDINYTFGGLHLSALAVGQILAGLTGERIAQRRGRAFAVRLGAIAAFAGFAALALGRHISLTLFGVFILGFCGSLIMVMVQAILSDQHGEQRAVAIMEANIGASLGATLAPLCVGIFQRYGLGWRWALFFGLVLMALMVFQYPKQTTADHFMLADHSRVPGKKLPPLFWLCWCLVLLVIAAEWALMIWSPDFLEKVVGLSRVQAATSVSVFFLATVLGRVLGSRLARMMPAINVLWIAFGASLVGFPLFWLGAHPAINLAGLFIAGIGISNLFPIVSSIAIGIAPEQSNRASARTSLGIGVSVLFSPFILGWTADRVGIQAAYGMVPFILFFAIALTFIINRFIRRV
ncbi:MAG: MFS transporter [Omnitrophica WOR_2 bacterium]